MKPALRVAAMALVCGMIGSGIVAENVIRPTATLPAVTSSTALKPVTNQGQVMFRSYADGFEFVVPPGWVVSNPCRDRVMWVLVRRPVPGLEDGFRLGKCSGPDPQDCMGDDGMLAKLVSVTDVQMAGNPAKEFTYDRQTVAGTRIWKELVSVLHVQGRTYGLIVQIPHLGVEQEYLGLYRQIRDSFRLVDI